MSQPLMAFMAWASANADQVRDDRQVAKAYEAFFATEYGRMVLIHLFVNYDPMSASFVPGREINDAIFMDGMKQVVSEIITKALAGDALNPFLPQAPEGNEDDRRPSPILD
jgi:hypothetical protein